MSTASAFGFSAYDPLGSYFEGSINSYFDKKSEKRAYQRQLQLMEKQYEYAQRYAENTPSWTVKGLRNAGLNPILAVSNGVNTSAQAPMVPSAASYRSPNTSRASFSGSGLLPFDRRITKQNADAQTLAAQAADKQADAALIKANTDRGESAQRIAKMLQEVEKLRIDTNRSKGDGGYRQEWMSDIHRLLKPFYDTGVDVVKWLYDTIKHKVDEPNSDGSPDSYLRHSPTRPIEPIKKRDHYSEDDYHVYEYNGRKYRWRNIPKD